MLFILNIRSTLLTIIYLVVRWGEPSFFPRIRNEYLAFLSTALALTLSLVREIAKRGEDSLAVTVWKFFSYYTTLSNVLVLLWSGVITFSSSQAVSTFALNANIAAAITFYIFTVGIANYLIYGWLKLSFFERIADLFVHAITPLATLTYWLLFSEKQQFEYSLVGYWLIFPLSYALYTILHGKWSEFYPYEFTNINELGVKKVFFNALALSICLLIGATFFIFIGKVIGHF